MTTPTDLTARDLRALAHLVDAGRVIVVRHENLLAVLRPEVARERQPAPKRTRNDR